MDPLLFEPFFRPQIWGGRRLETYLGAQLPGPGAFGEAWMLSAQSLHVSRVSEGPLKGESLAAIWSTRRAELTGLPGPAELPFPLLIKVLDCQELLSIQVHPNDEIAARFRPGELGKTEAWVILHAEPGSKIYAGLKPGVTKEELARKLDDGSLAECLHAIAPKKGECVFLPAGVVHAVGGGVLMAEVQQSSDATFRLFDWNRLGPDGKPRELHRTEALASIDWSAGPVQPTAGKPWAGLVAGNQAERLVDCRYFAIDRFELGAEQPVPGAGELSIWIVLEGSATLSGESNEFRRTMRPGETVLVPATAGPLRWTPCDGQKAVILGVPVPIS